MSLPSTTLKPPHGLCAKKSSEDKENQGSSWVHNCALSKQGAQIPLKESLLVRRSRSKIAEEECGLSKEAGWSPIIC